jgi:hypothetical protein
MDSPPPRSPQWLDHALSEVVADNDRVKELAEPGFGAPKADLCNRLLLADMRL